MIYGEYYLLDILDTAGQEEYSAIRDQYMRYGQGFIIIYSIDSIESFKDIELYINQIQKIKNIENIPIIVVGNKCDKEDQRFVSREEGREKANKHNALFFETSANDFINIEETFIELT